VAEENHRHVHLGQRFELKPPKQKSDEIRLKSASPVTHSVVHDYHEGDGDGDDNDNDGDTSVQFRE
jgi:hypothetical protein